jgi:hypothetical protein
MENNLDIQIRIMAQGMQNAAAVRSEINKLGSATGQFSSTAKTNFDNVFKSFQSLGSRINVQGQRMTMSLTLPLVAFANSAITAYIDTEKAFLGLDKVFNGTADDLQMLKDKAFDLSTTFGLPVEDVTLSMVEFAKAGFTVREEIAKLAEVAATTSLTFDIDMEGAIKGVKSVML